MRLTQFSDYSLRLLVYLAERPDISCTVREIAEWYGISRHHLIKVAHNLAKLGFVASSKGQGGGLRLAKPATDISLADVVRRTEPDFNIVECFDMTTNTCRIARGCGLKHVLRGAANSFMAHLESHTLASLARLKSPTSTQQKELTHESSREIAF